MSFLVMGSSFAADNLEQQVDAIFTHVIAPDEPGAAVEVIKDGRTIFHRGYGVRDLGERGTIDEHTNFRLASVTKQFTAMAIMLLVHDGTLHYEDHLADVFPDFPPYGKNISIRNLLNHTSGLLDYEDLMAKSYGGTLPDSAPQIRDAGVLALLKKESATKFTPGQHWSYSNSGYAVLAMVVEKVSGKAFSQFLHDRIFVPLAMANTVAHESGKNQVANRAYGYTRDDGSWHPTDQSPTSAVLGDGGIYSSLDDLGRWDRGLTQHQLLSAAETEPALTPVEVSDKSVRGPDDKTAEYGFGWFLDSYKGHQRMWHYGETVGFRTAIERFPDDRLTVIVLCNRSDIVAEDVALQVADLYFSKN
jgi:CubicO group peptidase (beta-lactamase class C family)